MRIPDLVVFVCYMAGITIFGSLFYRKNKTSEAFTLGNRAIPRWVVTMSIFATFVSSISFIALPGSAFQGNWNAFTFSLSIPVASVMAVFFFVPLYRKVNSPSAYTFLEDRFGPWARIYVSVCYLLTQLMRVGTILYLLALVLNAVSGWKIAPVIVVTGLAVMIYSLLGGMQAVVWTDAIQSLILITGALVCALYLMFGMPEGPGQLFSIAMEDHKFSLGSFGLNLDESTFWIVLIYGVFINLQNFGIDQNYVQRYMVARNDTDARRSAFFGGMLYIPVSFIFFFIGTALFSFYHSGAAQLPAELADIHKSDRIFPYFIVHELPVGMSGLLIASIFAAGMSTISTSFNSSATVFLTDYYKRYFNVQASNKDSMKVLYIASFIISVLGILIGVAMINVKSALDAWWKLASIFSGGMLGLFLLAAFSRIKRSGPAIIGIVAGIALILYLSAGPLVFGKTIPGGQLHGYLTIVFGTLAIFITGFLVTWLTTRSRKSTKH
ncbi:MAG: sodium:solute symporter [Bacteroidales bacterium]|nr:sodium:solute symporter [Bacteroidales bacterium]